MNRTHSDILRIARGFLEEEPKSSIGKQINSLRESLFAESTNDYVAKVLPWSKPLEAVNQYITVPEKDINTCTEYYKNVSNKLSKNLNWPEKLIKIYPQGSSATRTLIRSVGNKNFDVDAVCEVDATRLDIHQFDPSDPIKFFNDVGKGLDNKERKNRCWHVPSDGKSFYLEFTPSIPLVTVNMKENVQISIPYNTADKYKETELAVVDNKLKEWKTSNPKGFSEWVNDAAKLNINWSTQVSQIVAMSEAQVDPVPSQTVELYDTLRVAIRLFKRHRDMCIYRRKIREEYKPISIVIVTLLTSAYRALFAEQRRFMTPFDLLLELATMLPYMAKASIQNERYYVDNPTVIGENFTEKWNYDNGDRAKAFFSWCDLMQADINSIISQIQSDKIHRKVMEIFGCPWSTKHDNNLRERIDSYQLVRRPPPTKGLA